jgi:hypothetical protein
VVKKNVELVATWPKVTEDHVVHVVHVVMMMDPCSATWTSPQRKRHAAATRQPRGSHAAGHAAKQAEPTHRRPPRPPYYSTAGARAMAVTAGAGAMAVTAGAVTVTRCAGGGRRQQQSCSRGRPRAVTQITDEV